jgi:hypothetical protein
MHGPGSARCAVELRPKSKLGSTQAGGLAGTHHFCFATFQRPDWIEWGALRALNEYRLEAGATRAPSFYSGFDIITIVLGGTLRRLGTYAPRQLLHAASVELVSPGRGVNLGVEAVGDEAASYIEIWIKSGPGRREPRRDWRARPPASRNRPLAAGPRAAAGALRLRSDARVWRKALAVAEKTESVLGDAEWAYLLLHEGEISANGTATRAGDALAISGPGLLEIDAATASEFLLICGRHPDCQPDR